MPIPSLDLFSGIGGFSLALKSIAKPVAYCELDETCRGVLQDKMKRGVLHAAAIFPDVRKLRSEDLPVKPQLICAGFPCQDVSSCNTGGKGLRGERSGLVLEVLRLARDMPSVKMIFLENSPMILSRGLPLLEKALRSLGFKLKWKIISASECGAPHERRRWWAMACRGTCPILKPVRFFRDPWQNHPLEPCDRLIIREHDPQRCQSRKLIQRLGSSVVPLVVQVAWNSLITSPHTLPVFEKRHTPLILVHKLQKFPMRTWSTPMNNSGSSLNQSHFLDARAVRNLSNQIFYDHKTKVKLKSHKKLSETHDINVRFIEYLMGYPAGYTAY